MLIDWPTVIAQLINFAILVFALKYFLYDRVVAVMKERQQNIHSAQEEAERRRREADGLAEELEAERRELKSERDQLMEQARNEAHERREEMLEEAHARVDGLERDWRQNVRSHQERLIRQLQEQTGRHAVDISRRALSDLAAADLEERIIVAFAERLEGSVDELAEALKGARDGIRIRTAFEVGDEHRQRVEERLREVASDGLDIVWEVEDSMIAGITFRAASYEVGWTIDRYLAEIADDLHRTIADQVGQGDREEQ